MNGTLELDGALRACLAERIRAYMALTKPRISALVMAATALGFLLADEPGFGWADLIRLMATVLGTGLVAGGANALNQYLEAAHDARMVRTADRPIPSGRLTPGEALAFGCGVSAAGLLCLLISGLFLASVFAATALTSYVFAYTPLKRATSLCVFVGAIPGALPPVIGWTAAGGSNSVTMWILFAIVYFWQLPHFAAIAWLYREDYRKAGYPMLPVLDVSGLRLNVHVITNTVALVFASLLPMLFGVSGMRYGFGAVVLGVAFLASGVYFLLQRNRSAARFQVLASIVYLPLLFSLMVLDRLPTIPPA